MKKIVVEYTVLSLNLLLINLLLRWIGWLSDIPYLSSFFIPLGMAILFDGFGRLKRKWRVAHGKPEWKENEFPYSAGEVLTARLEDAFLWCKQKLGKR